MKLLDKYIAKKFLTSFFFVLILFSVITTVFDLTEKIDKLLEKEVPLNDIFFGYYLNFIPYIDAMLSPLFIFISVIFFTSRMAYNSEIIAILASGISFNRLFAPYFAVALLLGTMLFFTNHMMVPETNKGRLAFDYAYFSNAYRNLDRHQYIQIKKNQYVYLENYNPKDSIGYKFSYEIIKDGKLISKLRANRISWKSNLKKWRLKNYYIRNFDRLGEEVIRGSTLDTSFIFTPGDLAERHGKKEEMNSLELIDYINKLKLRGAENIKYYQIELHRRSSDAFMVLVLTLIGMTIAMRRVRGGSGLHLVIGILLSACYIIFTRFSTTFATNGNLSPLLSVWIPNIIFGMGAFYLARKAPK